MGTKTPYLAIFGLEFENNIVIFEISALEFVKNEFLTHTVNFGKGSAFSKVSGSTFSEGLGPGAGLCSLTVIFRQIRKSMLYVNIEC